MAIAETKAAGVSVSGILGGFACSGEHCKDYGGILQMRLIDAASSVAYIVLAFLTFKAQVYWEPWFIAILSLCWGIRAAVDAFENE